MMKGWEIMKAVSEGTDYLRTNSEAFLPLEPREDYDSLYGKSKSCSIQSFYTKIDKSSYRSCS